VLLKPTPIISGIARCAARCATYATWGRYWRIFTTQKKLKLAKVTLRRLSRARDPKSPNRAFSGSIHDLTIRRLDKAFRRPKMTTALTVIGVLAALYFAVRWTGGFIFRMTHQRTRRYELKIVSP